MKLLQKSLLLASLVAIGTGISTVPAINQTTIHATTTTSNLKSDGFYYHIGKDKFIKASDVKIITNDSQYDENMIETMVADDFRLQVTVPKAHFYNKDGKKLSHYVTKDTIYKIGNQDEFNQSTYYQASKKDKLTSVNDSSWL
ncbi:SLAP domain-containing protein [Companilactobacillus halodurans]|uniref:S-layer protein C-terminal domain-containing protein n=1 Tax=Companilactobacillus halodurans TaxID=2584183 RepID=A0A5P0ZQQ1_9LACO|nr:SLAP domain-containing protein [Companilactobacillus halodurans]MQS76577.1 hypothetical protein [Companilactobacillus halodurans]MQS98219.1 hypothetical protein [Companilactobacillus halodurans]